jgi:4-amino-4-deoxy-L-arabinose transferase-like glycosyltransferase
MDGKSFIAPNRWALAFVLALLFGLGLGIRLTDLTDLPLDFHPTRQLFSAIKARGIYYQASPELDIPEWKKDIALRAYRTDATLEPPILDTLVAATYRVYGERLWIARIYSSMFWMIGGIFLYLLAREVLRLDEALLALTVYLLLPYGVFASRSFQPDPLMVMFMLIGLWAVMRWARQPAWTWAVLAGLTGGLAIFVKLTAVFFIAGGFIGAVLGRYSLKEALRLPQVWGMALLTILPGAAYVTYGVLIAGYLGAEFGGRFFPQLLVDPFFYLRWEGKVALILGHLGLALSVLGLFFLRMRQHRVFVIALWIGYAVFGVIFNYHIASHDYYSLPLIPIAALSLGALGGVTLRRLAEQASGSVLMRIFIRVMLSFIAVMTFWQTRLELVSVDNRPRATFWESVGEALGHQPSVIAVTQDYGYPLVYWGWQRVSLWPEKLSAVFGTENDELPRRFERLTADKAYFLVTDFDELERHPGLEDLLHENFLIHAKGDGFIIFDLTHRFE